MAEASATPPTKAAQSNAINRPWLAPDQAWIILAGV
jgi:hypothetical protein